MTGGASPEETAPAAWALLREAEAAYLGARRAPHAPWTAQFSDSVDEFDEALILSDADLAMLSEAGFVPASVPDYLAFLCEPMFAARCESNGHTPGDNGICERCLRYVAEHPRLRWLWQFRVTATVARAHGVDRETLAGLVRTATQVGDDVPTTREVPVEQLTQLACEYNKLRKRDKSMLLDEVMALTGWSRDHARRRMRECGQRGIVRSGALVGSATKFSPESRAALELIWRVSGYLGGRYLASAMRVLVETLERSGSLGLSGDKGKALRKQLCRMSPATIDRYVAELRAENADGPTDQLAKYLSRSRASTVAEHSVPGNLKFRMLQHDVLGSSVRTIQLIDESSRWMAVCSGPAGGWTELESTFRQAVSSMPMPIAWITDVNDELPQTVASHWSATYGIRLSQPLGVDLLDATTMRVGTNSSAPPASSDLVEINRTWDLLTTRLNHLIPTKLDSSDDAQFDTPAQLLLRSGCLGQDHLTQVMSQRLRLDPAAIADELDAIDRDLNEIGSPAPLFVVR